MREIKFRAWYKEEKKMCYGDGDAEFDSDYWDGVDCSQIDMLNMRCREDDYELMQFTGLLDKNGKEIYEGDIVKRTKTMFGEVFWDNDNSLYRFCDKTGSWTLSSFKEYEIIGNVYENPELLQTLTDEK